jgi:Replication initiator protein A
MSDEDKDARRIGRDEMNLCEFPITLLTDYPPEGCKTMVFADTHGQLTVTGSDAYGLPTAPDSDVIVGLIQLTKARNDFTSPTVEFTRYEILKLLGWPDQKQYYRRLTESLRRWVGVTLYYNRCWWDNKRKRRTSASFHILEYLVLPDEDDPGVTSSFAWNKIFFKSCRDGYLKRLDLDSYFSLKSAITKQLYRFLEKRLHLRPAWTFNLQELAYERVGMSRGYAPWKIKQKLQPALEELEGIGFLEPMADADRYSKTGRGAWNIRVVRQLPTPTKPDPEPTPAEQELIARGVTAAAAARLVRDHPERVAAKIETFDRLARAKDKRVAKNPAGFLVKSIADDYPPPPEFERARRATAERAAREAAEQANRDAKARERDAEAGVQAYWAGLTPEEQGQLDIEALAGADPADRVAHETAPATQVKRMLLTRMREDLIRRRLDLPPTD